MASLQAGGDLYSGPIGFFSLGVLDFGLGPLNVFKTLTVPYTPSRIVIVTA